MPDVDVQYKRNEFFTPLVMATCAWEVTLIMIEVTLVLIFCGENSVRAIDNVSENMQRNRTIR